MGASAVLVGLALLASEAGVAVLMVAVSRRWFARFRRGFLLSLMVALAGTGLAIAAVLGVWAYTEERDTLLGQIVSEMTHIAQIEQNEIKEDIADAQISLQFFATRMAEDARRNPAAVRERLRELQAFDPRFLQVSLMDAEGRILVSSSVAGEVEPANRIGVAHTLDGKPFVSDIYLSPLFKRWVIYISAPVKDAKGAVTGAVSARFDMQEDLKAFVRTASHTLTRWMGATSNCSAMSTIGCLLTPAVSFTREPRRSRARLIAGIRSSKKSFRTASRTGVASVA